MRPALASVRVLWALRASPNDADHIANLAERFTSCVGAGLPAMQAVMDRTLSRASPLPQEGCVCLYHAGGSMGAIATLS